MTQGEFYYGQEHLRAAGDLLGARCLKRRTVWKEGDACQTDVTCIPQTGTSRRLGSLADDLIYRLAQRSFRYHESLRRERQPAAADKRKPDRQRSQGFGVSRHAFREPLCLPAPNTRIPPLLFQCVRLCGIHWEGFR